MFILSIKSLNYAIVIICELLSHMLLSSPNSKVIAAINSIIISALGSMLFNFINTIAR